MSAEENIPVDCFRRRGQGAKRREGIRQYAEKSLTLRQSGKQVVRPAFCFGKTKRGIRTRREQTCLRKKTVRWTVLADVVKERSDAKVHGSAPKKSLALRHKSTAILIELRWTFSMPENRLKGRLT